MNEIIKKWSQHLEVRVDDFEYLLEHQQQVAKEFPLHKDQAFLSKALSDGILKAHIHTQPDGISQQVYHLMKQPDANVKQPEGNVKQPCHPVAQPEGTDRQTYHPDAQPEGNHTQTAPPQAQPEGNAKQCDDAAGQAGVTPQDMADGKAPLQCLKRFAQPKNQQPFVLCGLLDQEQRICPLEEVLSQCQVQQGDKQGPASSHDIDKKGAPEAEEQPGGKQGATFSALQYCRVADGICFPVDFDIEFARGRFCQVC